MLNSEELEELKILTVSEKRETFPNIAHVIAASNNLQLMGKDHNGNIRSFYSILLTHIFGTSSSGDQINHEEPDKNLVNSDAQYKLYRIKHLLYSPDIDLSQIKNIPQPLTRVLHDQFEARPVHLEVEGRSEGLLEGGKEGGKEGGSESEFKNLYMKKLINELLSLLWSECNKISSHSSAEESGGRVQSQSNDRIFKFICEFGVSDCLFIIFIREILLKEYEIGLAEDFTARISDHTVYTALSDAFGYNGLKLEENECYISNESIVYAYDIDRAPSALGMKEEQEGSDRYYLVSLPHGGSSHNTSENIDFETFRNRRKLSRDLKIGDLHQYMAGDSSFTKKSGGMRSDSSSLSIKERKDAKFLSESADGDFWGSDKLDKEMSKQFECPHLLGEQATPQLERPHEYSSLDLIMQLSPKVQQSMLKSPKFKNVPKRIDAHH